MRDVNELNNEFREIIMNLDVDNLPQAFMDNLHARGIEINFDALRTLQNLLRDEAGIQNLAPAAEPLDANNIEVNAAILHEDPDEDEDEDEEMDRAAPGMLPGQ